MTDLQLYSEISLLPPHLKEEVQNFVNSLKSRREPEANKQRKFGAAKGFFTVNADFDEPLEDFKEYM